MGSANYQVPETSCIKLENEQDDVDSWTELYIYVWNHILKWMVKGQSEKCILNGGSFT